MVEITDVLPHSIAARAGIVAGDVLVSLNNHEISDVLDYRFYMTEKTLAVKIRRDGADFDVSVHKQEYDDLGLDFATPLMDKKHSCENRCVFCFIDQLPGGMRQSLYFKDDDSRLSFLHGNYVTLTNMTPADIDRIITMHLSPVNVSVHTTNPELRVKMMRNKHAGEVLSYLKRLADAGITICGQIVLCRGLNDGAELDRTMRDLTAYMPALSSVSIVPVGLTKYRDTLYPLELFTKEECAAVIKQVNDFGDECMQKYGTRLFFCADEFYVKAELPLPGEDYYEDYPQIENGVGMLTSLEVEFEDALSCDCPVSASPRKVTVATGVASSALMERLAKRAMGVIPGLQVEVVTVINHYFGETITVSGLLTAADLAEQLAGRDLGDAVLITAQALRADRDVFLDDRSPAWLSEQLGGVPIVPVENAGAELLDAFLDIEG